MQASQENDGNLGPIMRLMKGSEVRPLRWTVSPYNEAYWSQGDLMIRDTFQRTS